MKRLALAAVLVPFFGCRKIGQDLVIMPDGSGKLSFTVSFKSEGNEPADPMDMLGDPDDFSKNVQGIVAVTKPEIATEGGWSKVKFTMYFEDINQVKFSENGKEKQTFSFKKDGDGYVFEIRGNLAGGAGDEAKKEEPSDPELQKKIEEMLREMMQEFEFRQSVRLPGRIKSIEGFQKSEGSSASYQVAWKDMEKPEDRKKLEALKTFRAVCGPSEVTKAEQDAFKAELEKAKKEWAAWKEEWKKRKPKDDNP
jgi:hypothetical protein